MLNRRDFLTVSGLGLASLAGGWSRANAVDSTWLTYTLSAELYWSKLPFLDRLRKVGEAGFTRYEFSRWKTKDIEAIAKLNEELGIQASLFQGFSGLKGGKWKEGMLEAATDAAELAPRLGAAKVSLVGPDRDEKLERQEQVDDLVEALKEVVEKVVEFETVLILEVGQTSAKGPAPLIASPEDAAAVVKAIGSDKVKFLLPIDPAQVDTGKLPELIKRHKDQVGYYRINDFAPPTANEAKFAEVLKAIQATGYPDPIGLGLAAKVDPLAAIEAIRKLDAAAKAL